MHSTKELLWLSCREKQCCHNSKVVINGRDLWRIARALELDPWEFTLYCEASAEKSGAFQLAPDGPFHQIVLAKRGEIGPSGAPCIFLWKLGDGHAQCGLGAGRPLICQTYPAVLQDDLLCVENGLCSCRRWSVADLDAEHEKRQLEEVLTEAAVFSDIVTAWNQKLERERTYRDFCLYVLDAYTQLEGEST